LGTGSTREIMRVVKGIATASGTITVKRGQAGTPTYGYTRANQTVCYDPMRQTATLTALSASAPGFTTKHIGGVVEYTTTVSPAVDQVGIITGFTSTTVVTITRGSPLDQPLVTTSGNHTFLLTHLAGNRIEMSPAGLKGFDTSENMQFSIRTSDGKAVAAAGGVVIDSTGIHLAREGNDAGQLAFHYHGSSYASAYAATAVASLRAADAASMLWTNLSTTITMNFGGMHLQGIASLSSTANAGVGIKLPTNAPNNGDVMKWVSSGGGNGSLATPYILTWEDDNAGSGQDNTNSFQYVSVYTSDSGYSWGTNTFESDSDDDTLRLVEGTGIEIRLDTAQEAIRISSTGTPHSHTSSLDITTNDIIMTGDLMETANKTNYMHPAGGYTAFYVDGTNSGGNTYADYALELEHYNDGSGASYAHQKVHLGIGGQSSSSYGLKIHSLDQAFQTYQSNYWTYTSDERLKTNAETLTGATEKIKALNPITFDWVDAYKAASGIEDRRYIGYLASEYATVFPNDVKTSSADLIRHNDGTYAIGEYSPKVANSHEALPDDATMITENVKTLSPDSVVPYLVAAIKELEARIVILESA